MSAALTFFAKVEPVLSAATWTIRGVNPLVKRWSRERRQGMIKFGVLLQNIPKKTIQELSGSVVYENLVGIIHIHDTKQSNLDKAERDLKTILKANFGHQIISTAYETPGHNAFGFRMRVSVVSF